MERASDNWFESESFWAAMFPFMFPETRLAAAVENVPKLAPLTGVAGGTLLDLACGPGHYAIPLAQAGYRVTGVDRTRFLLNAARERAARGGRTGRMDRSRHAATSQGRRHSTWRSACLDVIRLFRRPGGESPRCSDQRSCQASNRVASFLLDHLGKELLAAKFQPTRSEWLPDGTLLVCRQTILDDWSRIDSEWICVKADEVSHFHLRHWLYSGWEMHQLLTEAGFCRCPALRQPGRRTYGPEAERLIAVARRASAILSHAGCHARSLAIPPKPQGGEIIKPRSEQPQAWVTRPIAATQKAL